MTDNGPPASIDQFIPGLCRTSATVSGCRRPTPDTWNLERPACFEIVPTAARSGAADKSALPATTPLATPRLRTDCNRRAHARVQGDCAPSRIFIQGGARSDLLFTMSDNTHPAERTQPGAKTFASGRADNGPQTMERRRRRTDDRRERLSVVRHPPSVVRVDLRSGGARRDRTDDLLLAKQALSQLSYGPVRGQ